MPYIPGIFIRDYRDYLEKKRSVSSFCKTSNINDPFCKQINAQGQYLLNKTNQTPCFWVPHPLIPIIPKKNLSCGACYSDSCKELNALYNGTTPSAIAYGSLQSIIDETPSAIASQTPSAIAYRVQSLPCAFGYGSLQRVQSLFASLTTEAAGADSLQNPQNDLGYRLWSSVASRRRRFAPIAGVSITNLERSVAEGAGCKHSEKRLNSLRSDSASRRSSIMQQSKMVQEDISSDDDSDNLSLSLDGDESSVWSETKS